MKSKTTNLITIEDVIKLLRKTFGLKKLSRSSIYNWMKTRKFPQPIEFGVPRKWRQNEITKWIDQQIDGK